VQALHGFFTDYETDQLIKQSATFAVRRMPVGLMVWLQMQLVSRNANLVHRLFHSEK